MLDVLEAIARNDCLSDVLGAICAACDAQALSNGQFTSILLYDAATGTLRTGAAPRLPPAFTAAVDGVAVGPAVGSCGTAIFRRDVVIVEDIATDPLWAPYRDIAAEYGLKACWSVPVIGSEGEVLASFAVYSTDRVSPSDEQLSHHRRLSHLVAIAIERHRAEQRLRFSEQRLHFALEGANEGLWDWNILSGETYFSPRWETMLGYEPGEVVRNVSAWEYLVHPDDMPNVMSSLTAHLEGRTDFYMTEHRMRRKDGGWCWILDRGKVVERDAEGRPLRAVGTHADISDRKRIERDLVEARERAEKASRVKTEFLACMSHELRTPLNAIIGFSELLELGIAGTLGPRQRGYVADIHSSGQLLLNIVSDLLDLSRIEAGKMELRPEPTSLRRIAGSGIALLRARAQKAGVRIRASVPRDLPCVLADPSRLKQVLINLLSNAIKFTAPGGVITIVGRRVGVWVELSVQDTGIGMTPAEVALAQEPFSRIQQHYSRRFEGTGLGLSISKSLVELHGGGLTIASEKGVGTCVTAHLPLCSGPCRALSIARPPTCVVPEPLAIG